MKNEVFSKSLQYKNDLLAVHTRKVNFILLTINWVGVLIIILMSIASGKPANNPIAMGVMIMGTVLCTPLFYLKKHDMIQANIICYTMIILNFINNIKIKDMGPVDQCLGIAYFMIGIIYMTIYFNKKSFLIFAVSVEVLVATLMLLSENIVYIWKMVMLIDVSMLILYFVTKWGGELIAAADTKGKEAMRLLNNQQKIAAGIEQNTSLLNLDIIECNTSLQSVTQVSDEFVKSVQEVAIGVSEQAGSLVDINGFINNADMVITETAEVSYKMSKVSDMARSVVLEGSENIIEMSKQMAVIGNAVSNSYQTVSELQKSMDEINAFLSVITGIAEQTNLLSLNAAIEAARAGENGKGFAVVASEIRKLADQSVQSAGMINNIINGIKNKSIIALKEAEAGKEATKSGEEIVNMVNTSFANIQDSFNDIDSFVELELKAIQKTTEIFKRVQMEITNIANISEEHSAAAEEMLSSNEEINAYIENIYNLMLQIHSSSETLEQMTKQNKMEE